MFWKNRKKEGYILTILCSAKVSPPGQEKEKKESLIGGCLGRKTAFFRRDLFHKSGGAPC